MYLAYLDSVKHFRPEEKDSGGTALRTMVYHEVLLAYIDRAAMLGMNSIYIWSCPPLAVRALLLFVLCLIAVWTMLTVVSCTCKGIPRTLSA